MKECPCGSKRSRFMLYDARGIECGYACTKCEAAKRARYRPEVLTDANYEASEPIEAD